MVFSPAVQAGANEKDALERKMFDLFGFERFRKVQYLISVL